MKIREFLSEMNWADGMACLMMWIFLSIPVLVVFESMLMFLPKERRSEPVPIVRKVPDPPKHPIRNAIKRRILRAAWNFATDWD